MHPLFLVVVVVIVLCFVHDFVIIAVVDRYLAFEVFPAAAFLVIGLLN